MKKTVFILGLTLALAILAFRYSVAQSFFDGTNPVLTANSPTAISTLASNRVALGNIPVGASPFQMTNPLPHNVVLFIGGGVVTGFGVNGTVVASGVTLTGVTTAILQPGEWATITYTAPPNIKWKPL